jgi:hypothetical protein
MKSLFESLLRLYDFDGADAISELRKVQKTQEANVFPNVSERDASTFPYLR